jgi:hypothetical protein
LSCSSPANGTTASPPKQRICFRRHRPSCPSRDLATSRTRLEPPASTLHLTHLIIYPNNLVLTDCRPSRSIRNHLSPHLAHHRLICRVIRNASPHTLSLYDSALASALLLDHVDDGHAHHASIHRSTGESLHVPRITVLSRRSRRPHSALLRSGCAQSQRAEEWLPEPSEPGQLSQCHSCYSCSNAWCWAWCEWHCPDSTKHRCNRQS